jgi:parallel beta-helix repeat protein
LVSGTTATSSTISANTIAGNGWDGVRLEGAGTGTLVEDNAIQGNGQAGVAIVGTAGARIVSSTIAFNGYDGVWVHGSDGNAMGNTVTANSIHDNGDAGINLEGDGNDNLAAPEISSATASGASGRACPSCTVELFSDAVDEGQTYHGSTTALASGHWHYNGALEGPNLTATSTDGDGNTSEFSSPYVLGSAGFVVDTPRDDVWANDRNPGDGQCYDWAGDCSLRAALEETNARTGGDTITFDEMVFSTPLTITIPSGIGALPEVTEALTISAASVWDIYHDAPGVALDGQGNDLNGLTLAADSCQIYGLLLARFGQAAFDVRSADNRIGGTESGQHNVLVSNGTGLLISGAAAHDNIVRSNSIRGNILNGITIELAAASRVSGNTIAANGQAGILVSGSIATGNTISANSIYGHGPDNEHRGIELHNEANASLGAPTISAASFEGATGTTDCISCTVELFSDAVDEGKTHHGSVPVGTGGDWTYGGALAGPNVTATQTDANGNTSEFSMPYYIGFRVFLPLLLRNN